MFCLTAITKSVTQNIRGVLKDCYEPRKGCLGAACGSRSCGWEPMGLLLRTSTDRVSGGRGSCPPHLWI